MENIDLFNRHEHHQLSDAEILDFENRLQNDADFKEEFTHYQLSAKLVFEAKLLDLRREVGEYHDSQAGNNNSSLFKGMFAIALIIGIGSIYYFTTTRKEQSQTTQASTKDTATSILENKGNTIVANKKEKVLSTNTQNPFTDLMEENVLQEETTVLKPITLTSIQIDTLNSQPKSNEVKAKHVENLVINPCEKSQITFLLMSTASCSKQDDGSISVNTITGGTTPYNIYVNGNLHGQNRLISHLSSDTYQIVVVDKDGCKSAPKVVTVQSKNCDINAVLKLSAHEKWTLDVNAQTTDKIVITDKLDNIIYQNSEIAQQEVFEWNGTDKYGQELNPGIYFIYVYFKDNLVQKGSITISY